MFLFFAATIAQASPTDMAGGSALKYPQFIASLITCESLVGRDISLPPLYGGSSNTEEK